VPDTPEYINPWTPVSRVEIDLPTGWVEGRNVVTLDEVDQFTWLAGQRICIWQYIDLDEFMWSFSGGQFVLFDPGVTTAGYTVGLGAGGLQGHMFHEPSHPTDWEAWDMGISVSGENWPIYPRACEPDGPDYVSGGAVGDLSIASQIAFPATDQGGVQQHPTRARPWVNGFYGLLNPAGSDPGTAWVTTGATKPYDEGGEIAWDTTDLGPYVHAFRADGTYHNHVDVFPDPGNYLHHYLHSPVVEPEFFWPFQWTFALGDVKAPSLHGVVDSHDTQPWWRGSHTQKLDFSLSALFNQGSFWQGAGGGTIPNWDINVDTSIGYEELGQGQHPDTSNSAPIPFSTTMAMPWGRWMLSVVDENGFDTGVRSDEGGFNPPNPLFDGVEQVNVPWGVLGITVKARIGSGQGTRVAMIG